MGRSSVAIIRIALLLAQTMIVLLMSATRGYCFKALRASTLRDSFPMRKFHTLSTILSSRRDKDEFAKSTELEVFYRDIVKHVKNKESDKALSAYKETKERGIVFKSNVYLAMLSVCQKAEHLTSALELFNDMISSGTPPSEQSYLALIRCHCDGGNIDDAMALVRQMIEIGIETKLRTYQPILELLCGKLQNPTQAIAVLRHMSTQNLYPRSEQLTLILETSGRNVSSLRNLEYRASVDEVILNCSSEMLGITWEEAVRIAAALNVETEDSVIDNGILVESLETLTGGNSTIIIDVDVKFNLLWALNTVLEDIPGELKENFSAISSNVQSDALDCPISYQHEKYRVIDPEGLTELADIERSLTVAGIPKVQTPVNESIVIQSDRQEELPRPKMMVSAALRMLLSTDQALEDAVTEAPHFNTPRGSKGLKRQGLRMAKPIAPHRSGLKYELKPAEIVDISAESCRCPNCGDYLKPMCLSEEEKHRVRIALMKIATTNSLNHCKNLLAYSEWLNSLEEFKFIVDGANVAYNRQNFNGGKFSYQQIELIVKKIQADYPGDRILVVLPYPYAQKIVPNSVHSERRRLTYLTDADLAILDWLQKENMLFVTPQGSDDDWYWMYATVSEGRVHI